MDSVCPSFHCSSSPQLCTVKAVGHLILFLTRCENPATARMYRFTLGKFASILALEAHTYTLYTITTELDRKLECCLLHLASCLAYDGTHLMYKLLFIKYSFADSTGDAVACALKCYAASIFG